MSYQFNYTGEKIEEILNKAENLSALHEAGQLGGGGSSPLFSTTFSGSTFSADGTSTYSSDEGIKNKIAELRTFLCNNTYNRVCVILDFSAVLGPGNKVTAFANTFVGESSPAFENLQILTVRRVLSSGDVALTAFIFHLEYTTKDDIAYVEIESNDATYLEYMNYINVTIDVY